MTRWWQGLAARERSFVSIGVAVVVLVFVYVSLWEPAASGIRKARADLPQLRLQLASMQAMAAEAARLRASAGQAAPPPPADRTAAVRRSLERAGLLGGSSTVPLAAAAQPVRTLSVDGATTTTVGTAPTPTTRSAPEVTAEGERVRVRFDDIDYGVWVGWLAAAENDLAARPVRVSVSSSAPNGPVGHVKTEALFDWTVAAGPRP